MSNHMTEALKLPRSRAPKIVINANDLAHIEALVEGAMQNNPALANQLLSELGRAKVVAPEKMPMSVVSIGNAVTYRDETTGRENRVTLVYPENADISRLRVSMMTPIGVALLGLAEGATFHWETRDGKRRKLTVVKVEQPCVTETGRG